MQQNINSPIIRNSYGFSISEPYGMRSPQNKGVHVLNGGNMQNQYNHQ